MQARKHSAKWWTLVVFHNAVVHPLLPFGEMLDATYSRRAKKVAKAIFDLHDGSYPEGAG